MTFRTIVEIKGRWYNNGNRVEGAPLTFETPTQQFAYDITADGKVKLVAVDDNPILDAQLANHYADLQTRIDDQQLTISRLFAAFGRDKCIDILEKASGNRPEN